MVLLAESREDVQVTFFTGMLYSKVMEELGKISKERLEKVEKRVNVIDVVSDSPDMFAAPSFEPAFQELYSGSGKITCLTSKKVFANLPKPDFVILDAVAGYAIEAIRKIAPRGTLPVWTWMTSSLGTTVREWGPKSLGGRGEEWKKVDDMNVESPQEKSARAAQILEDLTDKLVSIPGYPPMYNYEFLPQEIKVPLALPATAFYLGYKYIHENDGFISVTTSVLEKDTTKAWKEYLESLGKEFYEVGFIAATANPSKQDGDPEVMGFLQKMQREHGEKSVVYISFGSAWWPGEPEKLFAVIDELIAHKTPFLISNASPFPFATIPDDVLTKIKESGVGYAMKWAPQDAILSHPATGWFLAHGGWNGLQESIRYKVPAIFWPIIGDQPMNAALMAEKHQAGFELFSVRGGKGANRPARFADGQPDPLFTIDAVREEFKNVLKKMKGKEGDVVRRNVEKLSDEIGTLWNEDGESRKQLDAFLKKHIL
ncbi:hypothetical protein V5O48_011632 [Marasmius crinis-equi]|uniref:UDP-Glycosyltransferase/glycogen phosphorylase n=1 Tax=Marasmius crinis-equi TaxID=585013 RepID=A0ABR3F510_9AGAR